MPAYRVHSSLADHVSSTDTKASLSATSGREKILIIEGNSASRQTLLDLLSGAGYEVAASAAEQGLEIVRKGGVDLLLLDSNLADLDCCQVLKELKGSAATAGIRAILLSAGGASERSRGLDLGADDVISRPPEPAELLARVRAHLRTKRDLDESRETTRLAKAGQEIAHDAFRALAITGNVTRDALWLDRMLRIGVTAFLVISAVAAGILIFASRRAEKETNRTYAVIAQLERGAAKEQDLIAQSRKAREEIDQSVAAAASEQKQQLEKQFEELRKKAAAADSGEITALRQRLAETSTHLRRVEEESRVAPNIIRSYARSVGLLHVIVAFRDKVSGQRLHYAGLDAQGEPLQDSEGKPLFSLTGTGPEVRTNFFGTGFIVAADGRILTNRHVIEPWWNGDEVNSVVQDGIEPVIDEIIAYFPDSPRAFPVKIAKVSPDTDLALVQGDLGDLKRPVLALDESKGATISGQPLVSMGYATGLAGLLARAGEETVKTIVAAANGNPKQVVAELARRKLIRPITTQGHIGDVLPDKIVYDAQTTSGGSGSPLFNHHGKVIGVTYAMVKGFSGSNFGVPIRYADALLAR